MQTNTGANRTDANRKRLDRRTTKKAQPKKAGPQTAQQTIPYRELFKDGICRVNDRFYTKSLEYEDINYQLAQADDQSAIFDGYCAFLNSFDSSLPFQLSFINHRSRPESKCPINIPRKNDEYSEMRDEYVEMLEGQIAKSNNGIVRTKLLTFGVSADSLAVAKPRLEQMCIRDRDYTGEDGLLYCGKCHTPKEAYFAEGKTCFGRDRHPTDCDCQRAAREKQQAAESRQKHLEKVEDLKLSLIHI